MDIKILDSWLKDYLDTKATPTDIAKYLSLCGPSVERIKKLDKDFVYDIEITTNRIDTVGVYGIAREASAILPRFGIKAKLKSLNIPNNFKFIKKVGYLNAVVDPNLCPRFTAVLIKDVKIGDSPNWIKDRLESAGVRALNNIVDISNYIMLALGQPVHTFDYDKIKGAKVILRESKKGENIKTLDKKEFKLSGGDIVIEDGENRIIDLCGVMGGDLSAIDENTKNVLLFVQTYNSTKIRKTSMTLAQRTIAATIFEKATDTELVAPAILSAIHLFEHLTQGKPEKEILDIYPAPYKVRKIIVEKEFIEKRLGITLLNSEISKYLNSLEFETIWHGKKLEVNVPSFRSRDVLDAEDVVEEIARIYGYHNLPSELMTGKLTGRATSSAFEFESKIKNMLSGWGGVEVYTLSLVDKNSVNDSALKLKNPLGSDTEYLRTSMLPSLVSAAKENLGTVEDFHLFEIANIYIPQKNNLPIEQLMLAGIFEGYEYRNAKGIIESLLEKLSIKGEFKAQENDGFSAGKSTSILLNNKEIGKFGYIENSNLIYYEFEIAKLFSNQSQKKYQEISKYPAQQEDITIILPEKTIIGEVQKLFESNQFVKGYSLDSIYNGNSFTFHIWYQDPDKTLTDSEVEKIRNEILKEVKTKFGGQLKN